MKSASFMLITHFDNPIAVADALQVHQDDMHSIVLVGCAKTQFATLCRIIREMQNYREGIIDPEAPIRTFEFVDRHFALQGFRNAVFDADDPNYIGLYGNRVWFGTGTEN